MLTTKAMIADVADEKDAGGMGGGMGMKDWTASIPACLCQNRERKLPGS